MINRVLLDTGPLVAILSSRDSFHQVCLDQIKQIAPPLITSWPVLTEAAWLLRRQPRGFHRLLQGLETKLITPLDLDSKFPAWCMQFVAKYSSLGVQLADASLVYLAEREHTDTVFTLDRRDFSIYRTLGNRSLEIIP